MCGVLKFSKCDNCSEMLCYIVDDGRTKPKPREGRPQPPEPSEYKCLVRAVLANKKISTVVSLKLDMPHI